MGGMQKLVFEVFLATPQMGGTKVVHACHLARPPGRSANERPVGRVTE